MKQSQLPTLVSLAALAVSVGLLAYVLWGGGCAPSAPAPAVPTVDPVAAYRLDKLNEVNDMVLRREIIPDGYLYYVDEEALKKALTDYNEQTGNLSLHYTQKGTDIANALFYEHKESPGDYDQPMLYYEWVGRIARHALYRNTVSLCKADPYLSYPLAKEAGGSYGMWAYQIHNPHFYHLDDVGQADAYFTLVDDLLAQLEEARGQG